MWPWRHLEYVFSNVGSWSSDKILQMKTLHCMSWWSSMLDLEFYRLYNGLRARDLMPCLCRDFFAIFTKVYRVFCHFLPWFSTVPSQQHQSTECNPAKIRESSKMELNGMFTQTQITKHQPDSSVSWYPFHILHNITQCIFGHLLIHTVQECMKKHTAQRCNKTETTHLSSDYFIIICKGNYAPIKRKINGVKCHKMH